ncbi:MAG: SDR family NAD(P)-dependent oxidoreductase, partial [Deltaproteobacteria bacterium]|nr:SDR family NAD(P)-dependent oxidoreductase [Deltaproteobacteria bacterium]
MRLKDKKAIVTGASSGIGRAIALRFGQEGAHVCVVGRSHFQAAEEVAGAIKDMGRQALAAQADVSKMADIDRVVSQTAEELGGIDILVNNAGIYYLRSFEETTEEEYDKTLAVNLKSVF